MPIFGIGLHVLIAVFFAIHAIRNHRNTYWLFILFSFPLLGSAVYFFVEYLPNSRAERKIGKVANIAVGLLDPGREVRDARQAFDLSPSAQNQFRLAKALALKGELDESIRHFDACLNGPFARDPEIRQCAAEVKLGHGDTQQALELTQGLIDELRNNVAEPLLLLHAKALETVGRADEAGEFYASARDRFGSIEARARYGLWASANNRRADAVNMLEELRKDSRHWNSHTRSNFGALLKQLEQALASK